MSNLFNFKTYDISDNEAVFEASREGQRLWKWAVQESYKDLTKEELEEQLNQFGIQLAPAGKNCKYKFLRLINDNAENMPSDVRVDLLYKPTYVATAVYIYANTKYPELFDKEQYKVWFMDLLEASQGRNLMGHGYDAEDELLKDLLLFAKAGAKNFIAEAPEYARSFCNMLENHFTRLENDVYECAKAGKPYYVHNFCLSNKDDIAKEILYLMQ